MNKKQKVLFFDIDGTLLTAQPFTIPESTRRALKMAQEAGHLTFINSGRTMSMIPEMIRELGFDGYVCGCGSEIYMHGKLLHSSSIPHDICAETVAAVKEYRIAAIYESRERLLFDSTSLYSNEVIEGLKKVVPTVDLASFSPEEKSSYTFDKFLVFFQPDSDEEAFLRFCEDKYTCFDHERQVFEVTQKDHSKATGIRFLLDYLGLPLENSFAFGDSSNDLPMLQYAGNSIAMGNSSPEILPYCTYTTTDIQEDGIYNALAHFGLLGE